MRIQHNILILLLNEKFFVKPSWFLKKDSDEPY